MKFIGTGTLIIALIYFSQSDESPNITSDDESSRRSVRFHDNTKTGDDNAVDRDFGDGQSQAEVTEDDAENANTVPPKRHSTLFHNALRPNSAVRQLFPAVSNPAAAVTASAPLTSEALRAFEEAKRCQLPVSTIPNDVETDTIRRTIERNALRRSLIKYEPK